MAGIGDACSSRPAGGSGQRSHLCWGSQSRQSPQSRPCVPSARTPATPPGPWGSRAISPGGTRASHAKHCMRRRSIWHVAGWRPRVPQRCGSRRNQRTWHVSVLVSFFREIFSRAALDWTEVPPFAGAAACGSARSSSASLPSSSGSLVDGSDAKSPSAKSSSGIGASACRSDGLNTGCNSLEIGYKGRKRACVGPPACFARLARQVRAAAAPRRPAPLRSVLAPGCRPRRSSPPRQGC